MAELAATRGPYKPGAVGNPAPPSEYGWEKSRLTRGQRYRIIKPFTDADGHWHQIGEEWIFLGASFSKFDDELTLCTAGQDATEWQIPLTWKDDKQQDVIEDCEEYFTPA